MILNNVFHLLKEFLSHNQKAGSILLSSAFKNLFNFLHGKSFGFQ